MTTATPRKVPCPTCGTLLAWSIDNAWRPFCSERCKLMDLGQWANEQYRVAGEPLPDPDEPVN
ncbi:DNA gyrase inhibitor YacG [Chitinimonas arctica]|uniref:DNA gyrase inhibitor YacG n=1 Tax=Chitinimonas arctica TaxID=2594795 RepID=A0A516SDW6_9NEIS|nr:DNA gyrase inhibitor YacG [Chitinimonas arctica]QDQ26354.1 DNA gyrase inhibitor YacG [Chitinimonas arctica]